MNGNSDSLGIWGKNTKTKASKVLLYCPKTEDADVDMSLIGLRSYQLALTYRSLDGLKSSNQPCLK